MPKKTPILLILAFVAVFISPLASADDLIGLYEKALRSDPLLQEAAANRLATLETRPQARASLLPLIFLQGQYDDQSSDGTFSNFSPSLGTTIQTKSEGDSQTLSYQLQLQQPLFRWDRWVSLKRADKVLAQAEANYAAAEQNLAVRVTQRYFLALTARDALKAETLNKQAIARQLEQNETRFDVGLIAITDVLESRAAYDQSVASEIESKRILATAKENLREIVGERVGLLLAPEEDFELVKPNPADADAWVALALKQNLLLEASRVAVEIANDDISLQRTGHYPTLDLVLSHGEFDSSGDSTNTVGLMSNPGSNDQDSSQDTISLQFNVPIYSGGGVRSRVRQAVYLKQAAQQRLERIARESERQTRDAYLSVLSDISRVSALKEALKSSKTALEATEAGFDVGTRTSVDVLNSRNDLLRSQVNYYDARYSYLVNIVLLKNAAGSLSMKDLQQINRWLTSTK